MLLEGSVHTSTKFRQLTSAVSVPVVIAESIRAKHVVIVEAVQVPTGLTSVQEGLVPKQLFKVFERGWLASMVAFLGGLALTCFGFPYS